jgi:hypothetical protein
MSSIGYGVFLLSPNIFEPGGQREAEVGEEQSFPSSRYG